MDDVFGQEFGASSTSAEESNAVFEKNAHLNEDTSLEGTSSSVGNVDVAGNIDGAAKEVVTEQNIVADLEELPTLVRSNFEGRSLPTFEKIVGAVMPYAKWMAPLDYKTPMEPLASSTKGKRNPPTTPHALVSSFSSSSGSGDENATTLEEMLTHLRMPTNSELVCVSAKTADLMVFECGPVTLRLHSVSKDFAWVTKEEEEGDRQSVFITPAVLAQLQQLFEPSDDLQTHGEADASVAKRVREEAQKEDISKRQIMDEDPPTFSNNEDWLDMGDFPSLSSSSAQPVVSSHEAEVLHVWTVPELCAEAGVTNPKKTFERTAVDAHVIQFHCEKHGATLTVDRQTNIVTYTSNGRDIKKWTIPACVANRLLVLSELKVVRPRDYVKPTPALEYAAVFTHKISGETMRTRALVVQPAGQEALFLLENVQPHLALDLLSIVEVDTNSPHMQAMKHHKFIKPKAPTGRVVPWSGLRCWNEWDCRFE